MSASEALKDEWIVQFAKPSAFPERKTSKRAFKQMQLLARQRMLEYAAVDLEFQRQSYHIQLDRILKKCTSLQGSRVAIHELSSILNSDPKFRNYTHLKTALKTAMAHFESMQLFRHVPVETIIEALNQQI